MKGVCSCVCERMCALMCVCEEVCVHDNLACGVCVCGVCGVERERGGKREEENMRKRI